MLPLAKARRTAPRSSVWLQPMAARPAVMRAVIGVLALPAVPAAAPATPAAAPAKDSSPPWDAVRNLPIPEGQVGAWGRPGTCSVSAQGPGQWRAAAAGTGKTIRAPAHGGLQLVPACTARGRLVRGLLGACPNSRLVAVSCWAGCTGPEPPPPVRFIRNERESR